MTRKKALRRVTRVTLQGEGNIDWEFYIPRFCPACGSTKLESPRPICGPKPDMLGECKLCGTHFSVGGFA